MLSTSDLSSRKLGNAITRGLFAFLIENEWMRKLVFRIIGKTRRTSNGMFSDISKNISE
jgi:hypothetical protein